jgi:hypothetical protein
MLSRMTQQPVEPRSGTAPTSSDQGWWTEQSYAPARLPRLWWKALQTLVVVAVVGVAISWLVDPSHEHPATRGFASVLGTSKGVPPFGQPPINVLPTPFPVPPGSVNSGGSGPVDPELADDLNTASDAMDNAFDESSGYPLNLDDAGYTQDPQFAVWVVSADFSGYCLAGGPDRSTPQAWYSSDSGDVSTEPCG